MSNIQAMHSFLEEKSYEPDKSSFENNLCVRFTRKKFKCLIIFFLTICIFSETLIMTYDKLNFDKLNDIYDRFTKSNLTDKFN